MKCGFNTVSSVCINDVTDQFAEVVSCYPILYIILFVKKEILPKICSLVTGTRKHELFLQYHNNFNLLTLVVRSSTYVGGSDVKW